MPGKCANPECHSEFKRMGTGRIYSLNVDDPQLWGLPPNARQKVVWLCGQCSASKRVKFDKVHGRVLIVSLQGRQTAA